ncbi:hypothetical protein SAMN06269117_11315 [Balnearium lithotrophicum]|uniref:Uncharacterized protein n=1 Tax=Balnearium lithotrophicum TaxID=223788 RepID=A0A521CL28_9BACT|nr:hypothetical protein [Balnearium lithotrophicum]SMO59390.1 hypothetical protein SAMN06269117_11315 [Balnearium lithotrophicum]
MEKTENKEMEKNKENQKIQDVGVSNKEQPQRKTFLIKNSSGQDLTICGVRLNPFEKLKVELSEIPANLKRLEERGLIEISEVK